MIATYATARSPWRMPQLAIPAHIMPPTRLSPRRGPAGSVEGVSGRIAVERYGIGFLLRRKSYPVVLLLIGCYLVFYLRDVRPNEMPDQWRVAIHHVREPSTEEQPDNVRSTTKRPDSLREYSRSCCGRGGRSLSRSTNPHTARGARIPTIRKSYPVVLLSIGCYRFFSLADVRPNEMADHWRGSHTATDWNHRQREMCALTRSPPPRSETVNDPIAIPSEGNSRRGMYPTPGRAIAMTIIASGTLFS
jgi:hypothetical protein